MVVTMSVTGLWNWQWDIRRNGERNRKAVVEHSECSSTRQIRQDITVTVTVISYGVTRPTHKPTHKHSDTQTQAHRPRYVCSNRPHLDTTCNNNMSQVDVSQEILGSCKQKLINLCFRAGRSSPIRERGIVTASTDSPDCFPTLLSMSVFTFQFFIFSTF